MNPLSHTTTTSTSTAQLFRMAQCLPPLLPSKPCLRIHSKHTASCSSTFTFYIPTYLYISPPRLPKPETSQTLLTNLNLNLNLHFQL